MADLAGIDVGLTLLKPTSGICRTGAAGFSVGHAYLDKLSRLDVLKPVKRFDLVAIDGPVLPAATLHFHRRACEETFVRNPFQKRCKPGLSDVAGTGSALRRSGCDAAIQFSDLLSAATARTRFPQIQSGLNIVEAFPNAFLGVLLDDSIYQSMPELKRGKKFEWLLENCRSGGEIARVQSEIGWECPDLLNELAVNGHHEEQAGLVCALTAACAWQGRYTAVGEPAGGYFFLPPWSQWKKWAKRGLATNRAIVPTKLEIWIDGKLYGEHDPLP